MNRRLCDLEFSSKNPNRTVFGSRVQGEEFFPQQEQQPHSSVSCQNFKNESLQEIAAAIANKIAKLTKEIKIQAS